MDDFQKIIVQMLKVQMDLQQKSDERQQRIEEQWVQQQKELQQQQRNEARLLQGTFFPENTPERVLDFVQSVALQKETMTDLRPLGS